MSQFELCPLRDDHKFPCACLNRRDLICAELRSTRPQTRRLRTPACIQYLQFLPVRV